VVVLIVLVISYYSAIFSLQLQALLVNEQMYPCRIVILLDRYRG